MKMFFKSAIFLKIDLEKKQQPPNTLGTFCDSILSITYIWVFLLDMLRTRWRLAFIVHRGLCYLNP